MNNKPKFYSQGLRVFQAPQQVGNNVKMGFCLAEADTEYNAKCLAKMLNERDQFIALTTEFLDYLLPSPAAELRLNQGALGSLQRLRELIKEANKP